MDSMYVIVAIWGLLICTLVCHLFSSLLCIRCTKEWQMAVKLSHHWVTIVVASVSICNRPEPLRAFLYLDFMDEKRKIKAWSKLLDAISKQTMIRRYVMA